MVSLLNLGVYVVVSVATGALVTFLRLPLLLLGGLNSYLCPEEQQQPGSAPGGGEQWRARIRSSGNGNGNGAPGSAKYPLTPDDPRLADALRQDPSKKRHPKSNHRAPRVDPAAAAGGGNFHVLRIVLGEMHLRGRQFFPEFDQAITYSALACANLLARAFLPRSTTATATATATTTVDDDSPTNFFALLVSDDLLPLVMSLLALFKLARFLALIALQSRSARKSELLVSACLGSLAFISALAAQLLSDEKKDHPTSPSLAEKLFLAAAAGWVTAALVGPAHFSVRSFWVGTDQLEWNMPSITAGSLSQFLLYVNLVLPMLTSTLWINPMSDLLIRRVDTSSGFIGKMAPPPEQVYEDGEWITAVEEKAVYNGFYSEEAMGSDRTEEKKNAASYPEKKGKKGGVLQDLSDDWIKHVGMEEETFLRLRLWLLLLSGVLQLLTLRANLQAYLNGALLNWYESLHRSRTVNLELTRAKLILNSYFLCGVTIQLFAPGVLLLLFLGLSRPWGGGTGYIALVIQRWSFFLVRWITLTWAGLTCSVLALYRTGFFLMS